MIVVEAQKPGASARSPRCECVHCVSSVDGGISYPPETHSDYDNIVPSETDTLTNHQYLLCWDQMFGFILKDRNYGRMYDLLRKVVALTMSRLT